MKDVNLKIEQGQTIAIVGHTGSGKTTLLNLIPRLFDAPQGQVLIDGRPIREIPLETLRRSIGYVPQETFLFSDTVGGNIAFGVENATSEEIEKATEQSGLLPDVREFKDKFDTIVGERGITLSGGQKQRVAIARAILADPRILILDEATSSLDSESEMLIQAGLAHLMKGRTTFVIAHRLSTIRRADQILVVENGRIVERGSHEKLLEAGGRYADLYQRQYDLEKNLFLAEGEGDTVE